MPIDYSFEITPSFRDVTRTSLLLLSRPVVRSLAKLRRLRSGKAVREVALVRVVKTSTSVR
jgi:hypothetical protein